MSSDLSDIVTLRCSSKQRNCSIPVENIEVGNCSNEGNDTPQRRPIIIKGKISEGIELTSLTNDGNGTKGLETLPIIHSEVDREPFWRIFMAGAMYSGCSVGMVIVNKSLASR